MKEDEEDKDTVGREENGEEIGEYIISGVPLTVGQKLKALTDKSGVAALEDVLIELNTSIDTLGQKVQGLEDLAVAEAYVSLLSLGF